MLLEIAAASESISTPVSEKKLRCVKTGSLTNSWTHSNTPRTVISGMATRSKLTVNFSPEGNGPRRARAVIWKTWNDTRMNRKCSQIQASLAELIHTLYRWLRSRKPACEEQKVKTFPTSGRPLVDVRSSNLCSCTKDWYSDLQASISPPLTHPFARRPSKSRSNSCNGAWSSPPISTGGQKQLNPGLLTTLRQQSKARSSRSPPGTSYNRVGTPSWGRHYPPSPKPTKPEYQPIIGLLL